MSEDVMLKPCPFCGGEAWLRQWGSGWALTCRNNRTLARLADFTERECPIAIVLTPTEAEAIAAWNTRTGEDERIAQAVGIEKREARLNLENRMKEQLLEAVQAEREQIIKRLNRQIIGYIQDKRLDFETTATLKEATDIAIKIVKGE